MTTDLIGGNSQIDLGRNEWMFYNSLKYKQNIVSIFSYSENLTFVQAGVEKKKTRPVVAYQMEYAPYGTLRDYLQKGSQHNLPIKDAIHIIRELVLGIESIHLSNLVHRDIRPENVLVFRNDPRFKVCDFTLTRGKLDLIRKELTNIFSANANNRSLIQSPNDFIERRTASTMLSFQKVIGSTTFYSAPEEHAGTSAIDARADIFSLGGILYWLLMGFDPFELLLHEHYRELYQRYKIASDNKLVHLDRKRKEMLFGDLMKLDIELRRASLDLKQKYPIAIDNRYIKIDESLFTLLSRFVDKTLNPDMEKRYQTIDAVKNAVSEIESLL
jgi:serine/threonine protein kinase